MKAIWEFNFLHTLPTEAVIRRDRFKAIHKHATALSKVLAVDEANEGEFTEHWRPLWPQDMPAASKLVSKMRELVEESGWLEKSPQNIAAETRSDYGASGISALDWLVGTRLPEIYKKFFLFSATVYREGPYLDFASQILTEFKILRATRESIIGALSRARSGRRRRR